MTVFFTLLGSMSFKAVHKMLVKLTPGLREKLRYDERFTHAFTACCCV